MYVEVELVLVKPLLQNPAHLAMMDETSASPTPRRFNYCA